MFERFTDRGRRVVVLAQEEARTLEHDFIGSEHLLLALLAEGESTAFRALTAMEVTLDRARTAVEARIGHGSHQTSSHIPFTPGAKKVLEHSLRESLQLGHNYIGPEHMLLALLRVDEGSDSVLADLDVAPQRARAELLRLLGAGEAGPPAGIVPARARARRAARAVWTCALCGRDLYEVERWVFGDDAVVCSICVHDAAALLSAAKEPVLPMPTRVFGVPPPDALDEITELLDALFAPAAGADALASRLEDPALAGALAEQLGKLPDGQPRSVRIERLRFVDEATADGRCLLVVAGTPWFRFRAVVVRREDRWVVDNGTAMWIVRNADPLASDA